MAVNTRRWTAEDYRDAIAEHDRRLNACRRELDQLDARMQSGDNRDGLKERHGNVTRAVTRLTSEREELAGELAELEARDEQFRAAMRNPRAIERSGGGRATEPSGRMPFAGQPTGQPRTFDPQGRASDGALRAIDRYTQTGELQSRSADLLDQLVRKHDHHGLVSLRLEAVGDPNYFSAFGKMLTNPTTGHLSFTPGEVEAVQRVTQMMAAERAMGEGSGPAGAFALPFTLDDTIMLSSAGVLNPIRTLSRVITTTTRDWKGLSSAGVTVSYVPEATEATDASPTLAQPAITAQQYRAFIPYSVELDQDWPSLSSQLLGLVADGRNTNDATKMLTGSGTNEPFGILTGLSTSQRQQTNTIATYAVGDPWLLKAFFQTNSTRFLGNATFLAHPTTWDTTWQFVKKGDTAQASQFDAGRGGDFMGRPKAELSTMVTTTTTGSKIMLLGDFYSGYTIVDRLGVNAEIIPHLFGATNRFPTGQRGLYAWGRTGANVVVQTAFAYLEVK